MSKLSWKISSVLHRALTLTPTFSLNLTSLIFSWLNAHIPANSLQDILDILPRSVEALIVTVLNIEQDVHQGLVVRYPQTSGNIAYVHMLRKCCSLSTKTLDWQSFNTCGVIWCWLVIAMKCSNDKILIPYPSSSSQIERRGGKRTLTLWVCSQPVQYIIGLAINYSFLFLLNCFFFNR